MDTQAIIAELEAERDRLNEAIAVLQGISKRKGRRARVAISTNARRRRRRLSAAARKKIAASARKRWAKAKAAGRKSL